ncbi:TadE/TadG family type IV pilus assembly protein [Collinsella ureilytica]|uniref:TadE/TadG family type IV pilus assembly protein n=1 Tax=Collinsella ureilytica TaxID=2869515 RepID=UPI0027D2E67B|nr:TadE/TadG family type IV pilus assembly protein [Collinsella urealyticum]
MTQVGIRSRDVFREDTAQASVEAALLLPAFLILILLALQPVCLMLTQSVMEAAAAQTARLMITAEHEGDEAYRAFALRRLAAVPDLAIFHAGGPLAWDIELSRGGEAGEVSVGITGAVRPLPVLGAFVAAFGTRNARGDVELSSEIAYRGRPSWLEGSYGSWVSVWGA